MNYLYIAKASAGEARARLYAAYDIGYLDIEMFKHLNGFTVECSRLTASFIRGLKVSKFEGLQHKKEKTQFQREREEFDEWLRRQVEASRKSAEGEKI